MQGEPLLLVLLGYVVLAFGCALDMCGCALAGIWTIRSGFGILAAGLVTSYIAITRGS